MIQLHALHKRCMMAFSTMASHLQFEATLVQVFAAIAFGALLLNLLQRRKRSRLNLPPGPTPWPVVGNLLQLGPVPHKTLAELTRRYGPIVFLKLGSRPAVITSDPAIIHDIMKVQDRVFSSRPQTICGKHLTYDLHDLIMAPHGDHWRTMRRICVSQLLSPTRLKSYAESRREEALALVEDVNAAAVDGKEVELRSVLESFAMNVITDMILGKKWFGARAPVGREEDDHLLHLLMESVQFFGVLNVGDFIPWLAFLDLQGYGRQMKQLHDQLDERIQAIIEERREAKNHQHVGVDERRGHEDFVDVLVGLPGENGEKHLDDVTIKALVLNMLWSALDVPVNIAEWAMAELVRHPGIQQKMQAEMDDVVGDSRRVLESDLPNLPYLKCVVKEVFRMHPAGPFGVPRMNIEPAKVAGYDIPAFTYVMISNTELGASSTIWPDDAAQFRPERWQAGQPLQDPELRINPFGVGLRSCAGAALGSTLVLLSVATLVQGFDWRAGHGKTPADVDMRVAITGLMPMQTPLTPLATSRLRLSPEA